MHILLIHQAYTSINEPGGTRHYEFAKALAEQNHQVTIIASQINYLTGKSVDNQKNEGNHAMDGIRVIRTYTYKAWHKSFVHRMLSFISFTVSSFWAGLKVGKVDVVWGTSPPIFQGFGAWLLSRIKGAPFLFEVRDLWPTFAIAVGVLKNPLLIQASKLLESFLYSRADLLVINSPGFLDHVKERGGKNIELVPNGVEVDMFNPDSKGESFSKEYGLEDKFLALYAGAHGMSNDLDVLLESALLLRTRQDIVFVLMGDGKEKPRLIKQAESMGLNNVRFIPPLPKVMMKEALASAGACIAILKNLEAYKTVYPNKVFDYMASGRPVILAIDGVIRKVVEEEKAGIFVLPGSPEGLADAVIRLADNPVLCQVMGANGRMCAEKHFDRKIGAKKLICLLELLNSSD